MAPFAPMKSHENKSLSSDVRQRLYLMGFLICLLGVVGIGILFLMPDATLEGWLMQTEPDPIVEEWTGDAGSLPPAASGSASNGASHNESVKSSATLPRAVGEDPASIASAAQGAPPERPVEAPASGSADPVSPSLASRVETPAAPSAAGPLPKPGFAKRTAVPVSPSAMPVQRTVPESGVGEITILALPPGVHVGVADHVITEAPTTLRVPWPADYEMAVHVGDSTIYATRLYLSAENHAISFAVGAETPVAASNTTTRFVADAGRFERGRAQEKASLVGGD